MKKIILSLVFVMTLQMVYSQGVDKPRYQIDIHRAGTFLGTFYLELFPLVAPLHVQNFDSLVAQQFYDSTAFHRVVPGFVIQGGDPNSINGPISTWGQGQPGQPTVAAEFNAIRHLRSIVGAARDNDPNSATSQFYICVASATFLDGNYTVYGKCYQGMDIVDTIVSAPRDINDVPLLKHEMFVSYIGVNDTIPAAPSLTAPADAATAIAPTQVFTWTGVYDAVLYTLEISTDPTFSTINISRTVGVSNTAVTGLLGSTTYYWRVKSNNGGHESLWSSVWSFQTALAAPQLISPPDSTYGIGINPVFIWSPLLGAVSYTLQVSTSINFNITTMVYNQSGLTGTSQQVNGLNPNTDYYWRMRSEAPALSPYFTDKYFFSTSPGAGINEAENDFSSSIAISPNPSSGSVLIQFVQDTPGEYLIELYSENGQRIYSEQFQGMGGTIKHNHSLQEYQSGNYVLKVETESKIGQKILIRR